MTKEQLWRIAAVSAIVFFTVSAGADEGFWGAVGCLGCAVWGWILGDEGKR